MTQTNSPASARPRLVYVLRRAATQPVSLGVVAASAVLASGLASWPLGLLGCLAYGALVAHDTLSPSFWRSVGAPSAAPLPKLPSADSIRDPGTREAVASIAAAKSELARAIDETSPDVVATLSDTLGSLRELDGQVATLVSRAEDIARHLSSVDINALKAESAQLGARAVATSDSEAKTSFLEAKAARDDEVRSLGELRQAKDRVDATLLRFVAVLEGVPTKIVHMRALDAQALDQVSGGLNAEIESIADEVKRSEVIMKSLGEVLQ
jgi:hypothetical protein